MNPASLAEEDTRRVDDERSAAAALVVALALARDALLANYPDDPDPLCPRTYAVDVVLHHIDGLSDALTRHRAVLDGDDRLPTHID
ncbi:uncharacterized protein SOCEGT47_084130 [Sorangium cellulosum]|uniref:Uncharacterized protein n=1 Tax=Sorangium cellulosum TaxID=56 RepID=A0A4V0ND58_SORCE|nr:hypothetical protein [Sorangium cellulosum]AUX21522.1 uncharacterized protein SOCEGT47_020080 [Sorangium cellulosum]AUX24888.1 uncharacterized protein SOCEGT47_054280 [Sorangium cellulosum]AUX25181.1 uncharacterized protein SOCEGT47_057250 [Sorangium cellulosum]AUX27010.1 uncharacterized protein SOCEGT47_075830 [Sorangium cellulosum]AUX27815.1 uncharacterized protein SOCEGT47_084130 [Sorangium cellulosum]